MILSEHKEAMESIYGEGVIVAVPASNIRYFKDRRCVLIDEVSQWFVDRGIALNWGYNDQYVFFNFAPGDEHHAVLFKMSFA
jgi:hypothetical protein